MKKGPHFLSLNEQAKVTHLSLGLEKQPLLKVDNFLHDASTIRRYAVESANFLPAPNFYPGIRMPVPKAYLQAIMLHLYRDIEKLFGLDVKKARHATAFYSMVTTPAENLSFYQKIPHFDTPSQKTLAAIHYLSDAPEGGTSFYRHKALGYEYISEDRKDTYLSCIEKQFESTSASLEGYICDSTDVYEKIASEAAKTNTFLMYYGSSLHSGDIRPHYEFDTNPSTGRLTITSFVYF